MVDALGHTTSFTYDELGNRIAQTDANGHTTTAAFDMRGRLVSRTLPLSQTEHLAYDANGNLIRKTDFNGSTITYTYDSNNWLTAKGYPDHSTVAYSYTRSGQRARVVDSQGTTSYTYDPRDRPTSITYPDGRALTYTYDPAGNRTAVGSPAGPTTYTFDALNRLAIVSDPTSSVATYTYDAAGDRASIMYPNGIHTTFTYDRLNHLASVVSRKTDATIISSYAYTLGPTGNRLRVVDDTGRVVNYTYDEVNRLTQEQAIDPTQPPRLINYSYDAAGNRLSKIDSGTTTDYTYDANDRLLAATNDAAFSYDANGNMLSSAGSNGVSSTYGYDFEDRLISTISRRNQSVTRYAFRYDSDGNRIERSVEGLAVTNFLVDPNRQFAEVLLETNSNGQQLASHVYGDRIISRKQDSGTVYYQLDGQMSTRQLTDSTQNVSDDYSYDGFGDQVKHSGRSDNEYQFLGERREPYDDLYFLRARYYAPVIGRFLSMDGFEGNPLVPHSTHRYIYANDDPINMYDRSGEAAGDDSLAGVSITQQYL